MPDWSSSSSSATQATDPGLAPAETHELADDYPLRRVRGHADELDAALEAVKDSAPVPDAKLRNLAPELDLSPLLTP